MEFIDVLRTNNINQAIMNYVDVENKQEDDTFSFSFGESTALYNVAYQVYSSFCNNSSEDDGLSKEMNVFLDNLQSALEKLGK